MDRNSHAEEHRLRRHGSQTPRRTVRGASPDCVQQGLVGTRGAQSCCGVNQGLEPQRNQASILLHHIHYSNQHK